MTQSISSFMPGNLQRAVVDPVVKEATDKAEAFKKSIPEIPPAPKMGDTEEAAKSAKAAVASQARRFGGRGATILTGALGVPNQAVTQRKTLLGQ